MKIFKWFCMLGLMLLSVACEKEDPGSSKTENFQFDATIEPLSSNDSSKVYLYKEQWVFWEFGDSISIGSEKSTTGVPAVGTLVVTTPGYDFEEFNGVFVAALDPESQYFAGLHPQRNNNYIKGDGSSSNFTIRIDLPATQPRRPDEKEDLSFAREVFPMVAWYGGSWGPTPFKLDFHALGGLVRIHLFNGTATNATLNNIVFTSRDVSTAKQLSGLFNVSGYKTAMPYLVATDETKNTVTLDFGEDGLAFNAGDIKTFYLVLPALGDNGVTTEYKMTMTVNAKVGTSPKSFSKNLTAPVRRTGITNMRSIGVTDWTATPSTSVALAGCGTQDRPFKVYTVADLVYLRNCYNGDRKINGQAITENTYITIMRSDIVLDETNWNGSAISNFQGHLTATAAGGATPGITNNSHLALFQSIGQQGHVEGLTVKSNALLNSYSVTGVSPFCLENRGEIKNCILRNATPSGVISAPFADLGGLVARNIDNGKITGCGCMANLTVSGTNVIGGICLHNTSTHGESISECYVSSSMSVSAKEVGGICYDNQGTVKDSYFAGIITSGSADWGGIVYESSTSNGKVQNCYYSVDAYIITTGTVAGIVHTVSGGSVDYCRLEGPIQGAQAGGIVHTVSGGKVINCFANIPGAYVTVTISGGTHIGGGIAAIVSGGSVENSFVHTIGFNGSGAILGGIVGKLTGGTIKNCYAYEGYTHKFYGTTTLSGAALQTALGVGTAPCYLVGYSQTGVTMTPNTTVGLNTLCNNLNGNVPSGGRTWSGVPPVLSVSAP